MTGTGQIADQLNGYHVGQRLYQAYGDHRMAGRNREVEVISVGRKWVNFVYINDDGTICRTGGRFDLATARVDTGGGSGATVWTSQEAYEARVKLNLDWRALRKEFDAQISCPTGITHETIAQIRAMLP